MELGAGCCASGLVALRVVHFPLAPMDLNDTRHTRGRGPSAPLASAQPLRSAPYTWPLHHIHQTPQVRLIYICADGETKVSHRNTGEPHVRYRSHM
jgi:hypothetical protein